LLREQGHDALHTLDLPDENRTTDARIVEIAAQEGRVVVTKDADFVESFILHHKPEKLLLISTGNISNLEL
jgi:predicted nuclease of predicted toxin-antitoxin system